MTQGDHGDGMTWHEFYDAMETRDRVIDAKLDRIISAVEEERDSRNSMHLRFELLPCQAHEEKWAAMAADIAVLKANSINWRWMVGWVNRKTVWGLVVIVAGKIGWDISGGGKALIDLGGK